MALQLSQYQTMQQSDFSTQLSLVEVAQTQWETFVMKQASPTAALVRES